MRTLVVRLPERAYRICIGRRLVERLPLFLKRLGLSGKLVVVTERRAASHHLFRLVKALHRGKIRPKIFYLPGGEEAKSMRELNRILSFLVRNRFERQDPLLAFGGGAVGDAAGFAASTYLRGVPLIQVGTTLLAQVDSSIGGKTAVNLPEGKNLVGTFYQPRLVVSDVTLLKSLPRRDLVASLAEVVKYGMIRNAPLFRYLETHLKAILKGELECLEEMVVRSARIKAEIVERDERETRGERMILNYGHTWGHAFEAAYGFRGIRHGEAVALGMACAARLAVKRGLLRPEEESRQNRLLERTGLATRLDKFGFKVERVIRPMLLDKKKKGGALCFILPTQIGRVKVVGGVSLSEVRQTLRELGGK